MHNREFYVPFDRRRPLESCSSYHIPPGGVNEPVSVKYTGMPQQTLFMQVWIYRGIYLQKIV